MPSPGQRPFYRFTLDDLDELAGYVAAEANHAKIKKLEKELRQLYSRIADALDILPVEAAVTEKWSNGVVEGQVNRLKTLKRQMYGRAGVELLRARLIPLAPENIALQRDEIEGDPQN
jgi:hypothetical protein